MTLYWRIPEELRSEPWTEYGWTGVMLRGWPAYTFAFRANRRLIGLHVGTRTEVILQAVWAKA